MPVLGRLSGEPSKDRLDLLRHGPFAEPAASETIEEVRIDEHVRSFFGIGAKKVMLARDGVAGPFDLHQRAVADSECAARLAFPAMLERIDHIVGFDVFVVFRSLVAEGAVAITHLGLRYRW